MAKPYLGIWLDHREAFLIWADEDGQTDIEHAEVEAARQERCAGRVKMGRTGVYGGLPPHADPEDKRHQQAKCLYERIFRAIRSAREVYIFGPGQAKKELLKSLKEHKDFNGSIRAVASAQRMREAQLAARVREVFELPRMAG